MIDEIEILWREFELEAVPKDAPEAQRKNMRIAFLAGAWEMFRTLTGSIASMNDDAAAFDRISAIETELQSSLSKICSGESN
jgi:hypothetical protein